MPSAPAVTSSTLLVEDQQAEEEMLDEAQDITRFLDAWSNGETDALGRLMPEVYGELEEVAKQQLSRADQPTLEPTELVRETFLRLLLQRKVGWANRDQFYGYSAHLMRLILVERARRRCRRSQGEETPPAELDLSLSTGEWRDDQLIALDDALRELGRFNPQGCQVVDMRFFGGLDYDEIARITGASSATVRQRWLAAKLWLLIDLKKRGGQRSGEADSQGETMPDLKPNLAIR